MVNSEFEEVPNSPFTIHYSLFAFVCLWLRHPTRLPTRPEPKPKRKYTVSDKVLAANRVNLVQANADPEKKYRPTDKRKASTYANCLKAREGKRQKRQRGQATGVKYGLAVTDLYSTLGLGRRQPRGTRRTLPPFPWRRSASL